MTVPLASLRRQDIVTVTAAVDAAMASEGLLIDVRTRVISRLTTGDPSGRVNLRDTDSRTSR